MPARVNVKLKSTAESNSPSLLVTVCWPVMPVQATSSLTWIVTVGGWKVVPTAVTVARAAASVPTPSIQAARPAARSSPNRKIRLSITSR